MKVAADGGIHESSLIPVLRSPYLDQGRRFNEPRRRAPHWPRVAKDIRCCSTLRPVFARGVARRPLSPNNIQSSPEETGDTRFRTWCRSTLRPKSSHRPLSLSGGPALEDQEESVRARRARNADSPRPLLYSPR